MSSKTKKILGTILVCFGGGTLFGTLVADLMFNVSPVQNASDIRFIIIRALIFILGLWLISSSKRSNDYDKSTSNAPLGVTHNYGMPLEKNQKCFLSISEKSMVVKYYQSQYSMSQHTIMYNTIANVALNKKERAIQLRIENSGITTDASFKYSDYQSARIFVERVNRRIQASATSSNSTSSELACAISNTTQQDIVSDVAEDASQLEAHKEQQPGVSSNLNAPNTTIELMYCYNCGAKLREGSIYCENCGQKL